MIIRIIQIIKIIINRYNKKESVIKEKMLSIKWTV